MAATVDLSDVWDPTISMLWRRIYEHLDSQEVGQGMTVCRAFRQMLVSLQRKQHMTTADPAASTCHVLDCEACGSSVLYARCFKQTQRGTLTCQPA
jgi:hypothetical protein